MDYHRLMQLHLATVVPCVVLGLVAFGIKKGTTRHRIIGGTYMVLMLATSLVTLCMPAIVGPRWMNHFGVIHTFSVLTLVSVPYAYWSIRRGNVVAHQSSMIGVYIGAIVIAGGFTLMPGRYLHAVFFGN